MPGAMTLSARQKPQNTYQPKLGVMVMEKRFSEVSSARITTKATASGTQAFLTRPFSLASRKSEGSMPVMRPMNRQTEGAG